MTDPQQPEQELPGEGSRDAATQEEQPQGPRIPFWRQAPLSIAFTALIVGTYLWSTYPNSFQHPTEEALIWGAFIPEAVRMGENWRYFTAALLHADLAHLFFNAFGLLAYGSILEPLIGPLRLLGLYLISQTAGMLLSYAMGSGGIGASSIDFGLIGAYIGLLLAIGRNDPERFRRDVFGAFIFMLLFVFSDGLDVRINLWAHLGGFLSGVAYAFLLVGVSRRN